MNVLKPKEDFFKIRHRQGNKGQQQRHQQVQDQSHQLCHQIDHQQDLQAHQKHRDQKCHQLHIILVTKCVTNSNVNNSRVTIWNLFIFLSFKRILFSKPLLRWRNNLTYVTSIKYYSNFIPGNINSLLCKYSLINKQTKLKTSSMYPHLIFQTESFLISPKTKSGPFLNPWPTLAKVAT